MTDQIIVTVEDDHLSHIDELADELRRAGMRVDQVLPAVGVISGSVPPGAQASVAAVPGVAAVEAQKEFRVPPPDSDIQ